jgi:hypothetical protein
VAASTGLSVKAMCWSIQGGKAEKQACACGRERGFKGAALLYNVFSGELIHSHRTNPAT